MVSRLSSAVAKANDLVVRSAAGCWVESSCGRRVLDFAAGIGALSTGHCHPAVVEAVRRQAGSVLMAQQNCFASSEAQIGLLDALTKVVPPHLAQFLFVSSGSEAVDNSIKVARAATGRPNIIAFSNSFHGRTYGAMAVTHSKNIYRQVRTTLRDYRRTITRLIVHISHPHKSPNETLTVTPRDCIIE
jgi:4-aminobutyrate aminotransferase